MPLRTRTFDLDTVASDLASQEDECIDEQAQAPPGSDAAVMYAQLGKQTRGLRIGVEWARTAHEEDDFSVWSDPLESVTLAEITVGERDAASDLLDEYDGFKRKNAHVAVGVRGVPFIAHDPDSITLTDLRDTYLNIADLHPGFVDWMKLRIDRLGELDGDTGKSYDRLVAERRRALTMDGDQSNGSDT